ncbi:MAG: tetratricopeptide repeat protein, partial [Anaerolineae bacterium]|nr:tetratricopeptide repeat protein [Anaerolineae bacterium]
KAQPRFEESLAIGKRLNLRWVIADSLLNLGHVAVALGDYTTARTRLEQAATIAKSINEVWLVANVLNNLGEAARIQSDYEQARRSYEESQVLFRTLEAKSDVARSLHNLGHVAQHQGDYEQAEANFRESLSMFRELGNKRGMAECLAGLGGSQAAQNHPQTAARLLAVAESQIHTSGASWWPADQVEYDRNLTLIQAALDEETFARAWAEGQALSLAEAIAEILD